MGVNCGLSVIDENEIDGLGKERTICGVGGEGFLTLGAWEL